MSTFVPLNQSPQRLVSVSSVVKTTNVRQGYVTMVHAETSVYAMQTVAVTRYTESPILTPRHLGQEAATGIT